MAIFEEQESYAISHMGGIGSSDIAGIMGMSQWKRPIDIYAAKVDPESIPELDKECLWFGTALEPIIRERYALRFNVPIVEPAQIGSLFPHTRLWRESTIVIGHESFMLGSPDGIIPSVNSGLEIKCSSRRGEEWGQAGSDEVPAPYLLQACWLMAVCDMPAWNFAVLFSGSKLEEFRVVRDRDLEREMVEAARGFWNDHVLKQVPPPIDESESYGRYLARRFSLNNGMVLKELPTGFEFWTGALNDAEHRIKVAEALKQEAKNNLAGLLGNFQKAIVPDLGSVQWIRPTGRAVVDWKAVAEVSGATPELITQHTSESEVTPYIRAYWVRK